MLFMKIFYDMHKFSFFVIAFDKGITKLPVLALMEIIDVE